MTTTSPYQQGMLDAAVICEAQITLFLLKEYASNQPFSSFGERFACSTCAEKIRETVQRLSVRPHTP